jgi:NAD-dependent dihydropyrimidine dehydrogenase PreA subunit
MIAIKPDVCTGCGRCLEVCPAGALSIREGRAVVDQTLCRDCEACVPACPEGALVAVDALVPAAESRLPEPAPEAVLNVRPQATVKPWPRRILPVLADVISFTGREILPRILEVIANKPDKPAPTGQGQTPPATKQSAAGGQRARQRYRGGHGSD